MFILGFSQLEFAPNDQLCIFLLSPLFIDCHAGSLKLAKVEVFMPQKPANPANQEGLGFCFVLLWVFS